MRSVGWRLGFAVTGGILLFLSAAHESPWQMAHIQSAWNDAPLIHVRYGGVAFRFSLAALRHALALLGGAGWLLNPHLRRNVRQLVASPRQGLMVLFAGAYLAFTLKPTSSGWGIVLYLLLGSLGVGFLLLGLWPLVRWLVAQVRPAATHLARMFSTLPTWQLLGLLFLWTFGWTNLGSYVLFEHIPHIQDSIGQVFHGKIFLLGQLTAPSPEPRESFDFTHMINNGRWYSEYPPGHSLLMSLGHLVHAPWVINPLFGALCVVLFYFLGAELYDPPTGRMAALLGALSPFLAFMSSEFMNHTTTLFFTTLFLWGFARMVRRHRLRDALLTGFALGYAMNIRPLTAVAIGSPFALYAIGLLGRAFHRGDGRRWRLLRNCLIALVTFAIMLGGFLGFNARTNGDPFLTGYVVLYGKGHNPGFGHSGWGEPHTPRGGLTQTLNNLNALNKYLFEWPIPSLAFALAVFAFLRVTPWDWLLLGYASSVAFAYFFYWFQDWCFGPRFLFETIAAWIVLTARGVRGLPYAWERFGWASSERVRQGITFLLILCLTVGWVANLPALVRIYANSYWGVNRKVLRAVEQMELKNAVVFVRSYYGSVFAANDPLLRSPVIYVRDLGEDKNREVMRRFPDRRFYLADEATIVPYPSRAYDERH